MCVVLTPTCSSLSYCPFIHSNCARTEEIQNIAPEHRSRPDFNAVWGFTAGGGSHSNVDERNVEYERQRRLLQVTLVYLC